MYVEVNLAPPRVGAPSATANQRSLILATSYTQLYIVPLARFQTHCHSLSVDDLGLIKAVNELCCYCCCLQLAAGELKHSGIRQLTAGREALHHRRSDPKPGRRLLHATMYILCFDAGTATERAVIHSIQGIPNSGRRLQTRRRIRVSPLPGQLPFACSKTHKPVATWHHPFAAELTCYVVDQEKR